MWRRTTTTRTRTRTRRSVVVFFVCWCVCSGIVLLSWCARKCVFLSVVRATILLYDVCFVVVVLPN